MSSTAPALIVFQLSLSYLYLDQVFLVNQKLENTNSLCLAVYPTLIKDGMFQLEAGIGQG